MKAKTIKAIIGKKIEEWLASIEDEKVRELARDNTIVTGGCIASMLLKEQVNDFDIYFRTKETAKAVAAYYVARFEIKDKAGIPCNITLDDSPDYKGEDRLRIVVKSAGVASENGTKKPYEYFESRADQEASEYLDEVMQDPGAAQDTLEATQKAVSEQQDEGAAYRPVFLSTNAITLSRRVQLVLRFFGKPEEIHKNYDFIHCTNYWTSWDKALVLNQPALESLLAKELRYVGSKYPVCSMFRLRKFIARGWTVNAGQIVKIAMQISELDLSKVQVLEDQLVGVDVAYFCQLIERLKENDPEKINSAYLCEILDRMF